jgi:hypothetical protein
MLPGKHKILVVCAYSLVSFAYFDTSFRENHEGGSGSQAGTSSAVEAPINPLLRRGKELSSSPQRPHRLWGPLSPLTYGYRGHFPWELSAHSIKLTTHLHLLPKLDLADSIPHSPYIFIE